MARTRQTARKATGGKAPRKHAAGASRSALDVGTVHLGQVGAKRHRASSNIQNDTDATEEQSVESPQPVASQARTIANVNYEATYDTCFYSHTFVQGTFGEQPTEADNIFVPKFSLFQSTQNPAAQTATSGTNYWMGINFTSKYDGAGLNTKTRPPLNLVLALDISGSMGERLSNTQSKISLSKECILAVTKQLRDDDYFGFVVFNTSASTILPLTKWSNVDEINFAKTTNRLKPVGGTSLQSGINKACELLKGAPEGDGRYSRICFLTDMEATDSTDEPAFLMSVKTYSNEGIYTTIIGVGLDLTRDSVVETSRTPGCNYCNVYADEQFRDLMNKEFNYFVTPIGFNIQVDIVNRSQWNFHRAYGSAELTQVPLEIVRLSSEFPCSKDEQGRARSGAYIFSLTPCGERSSDEPLPDVIIKVKWEDFQGITHTVTQNLPFDARCFGSDKEPTTSDATSGIRKSVLLIRFVEFIQKQVEEFNNFATKWNTKTIEPDTELPPRPDRALIQSFIDWYTSEKTILQDDTLQGELDILTSLLTVVEGLQAICTEEPPK